MSGPDIPEGGRDEIVRRVSDQVEERLLRRLKSLGKIAGVGALVAGSITTYSIFEHAANIAKEQVANMVEEDIVPTTEEAKESLEEATDLIVKAQYRLQFIDDNLFRNINKVNDTNDKADQVVLRVEEAINQTENDLEVLDARADDLLVTLRDYSADLATLVALNQTVRGVRLASKASALGGVAEDTKSRLGQLRSSGSLTVFFQFADMRDELARDIAERLRDEQYVVPGEVHARMDSGVREVRYFSMEDEVKAQELADDVETVLAARGLRGLHVDVKPLFDWPGPKPLPRTLELWLSLDRQTSREEASRI